MNVFTTLKKAVIERSMGGGSRNLFFLLCLLAILAYGGSFAWYMLANFDLFNMIRDVNIDDSFYYFKIAKNLADGKFSTFDGGITRTNGYHPMWMLLITPFYWIFDLKTALFGIKAFEIMLIAGAVVLVVTAVRLARLPWILLFAVLPVLYHQHALILGMEAAAALFTLGLLFFALALFSLNPLRWKWLLAAVAFALPWVRLEYVAISLAATTALWLVELPRRIKPSGEQSWVAFVRFAFLLHNATVPLLGACLGILVYFVYNGLFFGGIVPVSGVTKLVWAQDLWAGGGYHFLENFKDMLQLPFFDDELLVALEVCVYLLTIWYFSRGSRGCEDRLRIFFFIGMFSLAAGHLAKFAQTILMMHPAQVSYTGWYYGPAYLMMALIVPVRCLVAIYLIQRFIGPKWSRMAGIAKSGVFFITAIFIFQKTDFTHPYQLVDRHVQNMDVDWEISSYVGALLANQVLPDRSIIGSWNAGSFGYFSQFPVVNLDGLVNSHDYLREVRDRGRELVFVIPENIRSMDNMDFFRRRFGITHFYDSIVLSYFENDNLAAADFGHVYFETAPFGFVNYGHYVPMLWSAEPSRTGDNAIDPANRFWERMEPHFDLKTDEVGAVLDGRLAQVFARECGDGEDGPPIVFLLDRDGGIAGIANPWENRWITAKGRPNSCMDVVLLSENAIQPIRMEVVSAGDDVSRSLDGGVGFRSGYDVYLQGKQLVYMSRQCDHDAGTSRFFLHVFPVNEDDLPAARRKNGFEVLDFDRFSLSRAGNTCIALRFLPKYDIARIRTGQYVPGGPSLWEGVIRLDVDAERIADVIERTEPAIRSDFDVYHDGDRLLYTGSECGDEGGAVSVYLHVFPVNEDDVPARHRQYGFEILDFRLDARRLSLDFYFKDLSLPGGVGCLALVELPDYDIARIRTGHLVPGGSGRWWGEFEVGGRKAP